MIDEKGGYYAVSHRINLGGIYFALSFRCKKDVETVELWKKREDDFAKENFEFKFGFHLEGVYSQHRKAVKDALYETLKAIPDIVLFEDSDIKVKHGSALFEKSYRFGTIPFLDASDARKEEFLRNVYSEYVDFFRAFDRYYQQHIAKK